MAGVPEKKKDESFVNDTSNFHRLKGRGKRLSNRGARNESSSEAETSEIGMTSNRRENRPSTQTHVSLKKSAAEVSDRVESSVRLKLQPWKASEVDPVTGKEEIEVRI